MCDKQLRINELEIEIEELTKNLPAHSTRPLMVIRLEELEEELNQIREELLGEDLAAA
ncbi:MAG: hypothetical protein MUO54_05950 [Anaerolineales bacterium]|nr:hypothetical protein [Anaerolineales bacterium]